MLLALTSFLMQCLIKLLMLKCLKTFQGFDMHASVYNSHSIKTTRPTEKLLTVLHKISIATTYGIRW